MDDTKVILIGFLILIGVISLGLHVYLSDDKKKETTSETDEKTSETSETSEETAKETEETAKETAKSNYAPTKSKKKEVTFKLGVGNVRAHGSNVLHNITSGDGTPAEVINTSEICSYAYHKKPHSSNNYLKGMFEEPYNTDYFSRNSIPSCLINPTLKTLAHR